MALFGKKSKDTPASSAPDATSAPAGTVTGEKKRGFGKGRKKDTPAPAPDTSAAPEEFDFSEEALTGVASSANGATSPADSDKGKKKTPKPKGLKSGTVVGLNIGADSIKAIELRVKGTELAITGMGMLPTPEDSIANGVVMSVASLSHAIRDVFQQAGIKSKRVVTSVAGTGALVVRVIEVPKMSDNELEDNMKVDADRYIPFPPSEVIMDFKALRDLPTDPDAPNMEVLLAAAQREIIDLHVQVLEGAKLDPRSIDVEPLAAVRALTAREVNPNAAGTDTIDGADYVDYNDVSAVVNIGASSTEISIVRGDVLVFTRNVPTGGQTLTQAIVDYFGLHWPDAEHAKRQWADALPQAVAAGAGHAPADTFGADAFGAGATGAGAGAAGADDWSEFGLDETAFDTVDQGFDVPAGTPADTPVVVADTDPFTAVQTTPITTTPGTAPVADADPFDLEFSGGSQPASGANAQAADPFDLDFFSQGPQNNDPQNKEPGEQHGQRENEPGDEAENGKPAPVFDFSSFSFDDEAGSTPNAADDDPELPTRSEADAGTSVEDEDAVLPTSAPSQPATVASAFDFPTSATFADDEEDESTLPTVIGEGGEDVTAGVSTAGTVLLDDEDDSAIPTVIGTTSGASATGASATGASATGVPAAGVATGSTPASSSFSFGAADLTAAGAGATGAAAGDEAASEVENFDFDVTPVAATEAAATTPAPVEEDDDFDINSLFGETAAAQGTGTAPPAGTPDDFGAAEGIDAGILQETAQPEAGLAPVAGMAPVAGLAPDTAGFGGFDDSLDSFGAGLTDTGLSMGIDEQALYGVLHPILEGLVGEIRRSLEYHATRYPDAAVQHITVIGGGAKLKNIDAYFAQSLGIPTTIGNPLGGITVQAPKLPPEYATEMGPLFVVALGLALRDLVR